LEIEQHLAASFDAIDMIRNNIFNQITTLTNYRKSLIHECVTGKRRITEGDLAKVGANV
jgi:type I restriction enzyme S subunit